MIVVMGAHLSEVLGGLITFQNHLAQEPLVHYESGGIRDIIHHLCFITILEVGDARGRPEISL